MSVKVVCPSCRTPMTVPDRLVGEEVECEECGDTFTARARRARADDEDDRPRRRSRDDDSDVEERPRRRKKKPAGDSTTLIALIGGGVGLLVIGVVLFLVLRKKADDNPAAPPVNGPALAKGPFGPNNNPGMPKQPVGMPPRNDDAEAPPVQGAEKVRLSNARWSQGIGAAANQNFEVDYEFADGQRPVGGLLKLRWKYADGTAGTADLLGILDAKGTWSIRVLGIGRLGGQKQGPIEIWVEEGGLGGPRGRSGTKISNSVTLNG